MEWFYIPGWMDSILRLSLQTTSTSVVFLYLLAGALPFDAHLSVCFFGQKDCFKILISCLLLQPAEGEGHLWQKILTSDCTQRPPLMTHNERWEGRLWPCWQRKRFVMRYGASPSSWCHIMLYGVWMLLCITCVLTVLSSYPRIFLSHWLHEF